MSSKPKQTRNVLTSNVPTNIVTGFLGVGKTSTILHLLKNKPDHERWAILVNEFGEIGIDGALFESRYSEPSGVYIREVPGGCMCCTAGLPMQVALTQLLRRARPDRLIIEPTGLGHPTEVLQTLNSKNFEGVLSIQKVVTLVDARQLSDVRYREHDVFQQQLSIADVIIANKEDLYGAEDKAALVSYLNDKLLSDVPLHFTEQGAIDSTLLEGITATIVGAEVNSLGHVHGSSDLYFDEPMPECGFIKALNKGEGFTSVGWRFSSRFAFDKNALFTFLSGVEAERLKATFITTNDECFAYNLTMDSISEVQLEYLEESRIEIIAPELNQSWEAELFDCMNA